MNVLEIVQRFANAADGITAPAAAVGSQDQDIAQVVELLNQEGRALSRRHDWQALTFEGTFTGVATNSQGTLASIIGAARELRKIKNETIWNRTTKLPVRGPMPGKVWQGYQALSIGGPYAQYRIRGGELLIDPVPTAGHSFYFEYQTSSWCTDATGTTYRRNVASDSDIVLLDDEIVLAGLEWRWLRKKGLSYAEEFASYEGLLVDAMAQDGTKPTLQMDAPTDRYRPAIVVPVGSWPL